MNPKRQYKTKRDQYKIQLEQLKNKMNIYSNLRLLVIVIGIAMIVWFYSKQAYLNIVNSLIVTLITFVALIIVHGRIQQKVTKITALYQINDYGIKHLRGEWNGLCETGEEYIDDKHNYSLDLDIFGKHSLFGWMNHTHTPMGKEKLKNALIQPAKNRDNIIQRQKAVKELSSCMEWVHDFRAAGMIENLSNNDEKDLIRWSRDVDSYYVGNGLKWFVRLLPILTLMMFALAYFVQSFPYIYGIILLGIEVTMSLFKFGSRHQRMTSIGNYREQIRVFEKMIKVIEEKEFESKLLKDLQKQMIYDGKEMASKQIKKLDGIMDMLSLRRMQFYLLFNMITQWDYHCVIALENWKDKYGKYLEGWLDSLGEMEALISIATIAYEQPNWVMPTIVDNHRISANDIGHPLIHARDRVCNNVTFGGRYTSLLVTGSNMSGKSTFLRTIGINLVLAYAGAPVCAKDFSCPIMDIYTSMRVKDDIDNKISSFYAELLRIKKIIRATNEGKKVFYLLDEIFKGTNSRDRHMGAKTLIKKLSEDQTLGLVSTHDLELADLSLGSNSRIKNYHFQEYYKDDKIYFDYKLYTGVSNTFNAVYLMKQIGIDL